MSSPFLPNTLSIGQGIQALARTVSFALTGGATSFALVTLGGLKDFTDVIPCMTIESLKDSSDRAGSGGAQVGWRLEETMHFRLTWYVDYTNAANGEIDVILVRDAVIPVFQQCIKLGNTVLGGSLPAVPNVIDSHILPNSGVNFFREMSNGVVYRGGLSILEVKQQYSVQVVVG